MLTEMNANDMPQPWRDILDSVMDGDRQWFMDNPGQSKYERDYVYGEAWPALPTCSRVTVVKLKPDLRARVYHEGDSVEEGIEFAESLAKGG